MKLEQLAKLINNLPPNYTYDMRDDIAFVKDTSGNFVGEIYFQTATFELAYGHRTIKDGEKITRIVKS